MSAMTSSAANELHQAKPCLPPKSTKYRAPVAPPPPVPAATQVSSSSSVATTPGCRREPMQVMRSTSYNNNNDPAIVTSPRDIVSKTTNADAAAAETHDNEVSEKPVVLDVKLIQRCSNSHYQQPQQPKFTCRSSESVDRLNILADDVITGRHVTQRQSSTSSNSSSTAPPPRSSFVDPNGSSAVSGRRSVYIELGEYQTLLKHGQDNAVYSLPQSQCYGDETLRAVRLITEKYDTFKRRQLRAMSFREPSVRPGNQQIGGDVMDRPQTILEESLSASERDEVTSSTQVCSVTSRADETVHDEVDGAPEMNSSQPQSTMSRTIVSLSRYQMEAVGHVLISSVEDVSLLPSEPEVTSSCEEEQDGGVSRTDRLRVEMFYRSRETAVYVCSSMADLLVGVSPTSTMSAADSATAPTAQCWVHLHTGVPVWLLNSGTAALRRRELVLVLADRLTGLPLWRDRINYLSNYSAATTVLDDRITAVHSLRMSHSLSKVVRLAMFNRRAADAFFAEFKHLTADPNDDLWKISQVPSGGVSRNAKSASVVDRFSWLLCSTKRGHKRTVDSISKSSISLPCGVVHVSRVNPLQPNFRAAFSHLLILPPLSVTSPVIVATGDVTVSSCRDDDDADRVANACDSELVGGGDDEVVEEFRPRLPTR